VRRFFLFGALVVLVLVAGLFVSYRSWISDQTAVLEAGSEIAETALGPIEYVLEGDTGPVLLGVHGTPGGYDQLGGIGETINEGGMRLLRVSRPGYLRTPIEVGRTPAEQADAYVALLDALGIESVAVMGISGGGPSSLELAALHPDRVWALVHLMGVSSTMPPFDEGEAGGGLMLWLLGNDFGGWLMASSLPDSAPGFIEQMVPDPDNQRRILDDPEQLASFARTMRSAMVLISKRVEGMENDSAQFEALSLTPFDRIAAPTLVVHGSADINVDIEMGRAVAEGVAGAEMVVIEGGDHWMTASHPQEVFGPIFEFLSGVAPN
jgi:pimeloyl-ACP methyl ester carboxylesterase